MYEAENKVMNTEDELIDVLLDFIIVSAKLAKNMRHAMKQRQIKEGGNDNGKAQRFGLGNKGLRTAAATINDVAVTLAELFSTSSVDETHNAVAPTEPTLTLETVRAVLADKSRAGFTSQIHSLLQKYSADKLSGVDSANNKALLADVEGLDDAT